MDWFTFIASYFIFGLSFGLAGLVRQKDNSIFIKILTVLGNMIVWLPYSLLNIIRRG